MSETPDRRNPLRLIVSKETQLRILWLVGSGVFLCIAATLVMAYLVDDWMWAAAAMLAVGAFVSLWISRRIAGPFYRIEKDLEGLLNGALDGQAIRLRPGDPLRRLVELLNQLIAKQKPLTPSPLSAEEEERTEQEVRRG